MPRAGHEVHEERGVTGSRLHSWCFKVMKKPRGLLPQGPQAQVAEWEQELNALAYEFYKLTDDEIRIIEEETK